VARYRLDGLIAPVGYAMTPAGVRPFYHPKQIKDLKIKLFGKK